MLYLNLSAEHWHSPAMLEQLGLSLGEAAWCGVVLFVAAFVRGYSGFGFSTILMAGLTLVLPAAAIVPLSVALEVLASIGQARGVWSQIDKRRLAFLLIAGLIGTPIGVLILVEVPADLLRIMILLFIFMASVILLLLRQNLFALSSSAFVLAGFVAGVVNGATAMSGLVLALFFALSAVRPSVMRATMIAYFFATDIWTGSILAASGFFDGATILRIAVSLPLLGLGIWLGTSQFQRTPPKTFRVYVLWLLILLCVIGLLRTALSQM